MNVHSCRKNWNSFRFIELQTAYLAYEWTGSHPKIKFQPLIIWRFFIQSQKKYHRYILIYDFVVIYYTKLTSNTNNIFYFNQCWYWLAVLFYKYLMISWMWDELQQRRNITILETLKARLILFQKVFLFESDWIYVKEWNTNTYRKRLMGYQVEFFKKESFGISLKFNLFKNLWIEILHLMRHFVLI